MSKASDFKVKFNALVSQYQATVRELTDQLDRTLEDLAGETYGAPDQHECQVFTPPKHKTLVYCRHCRRQYTSDQIRPAYRPRVRGGLIEKEIDLFPFWWCPTPQCDGAGFGYDIFEVVLTPDSSGSIN